MVVRKRKILMIRMLRLENRQGSLHCKFCIWNFPKSAKTPMLVICYLFIYIYIYILYNIYKLYGYVFILYVHLDIALSDQFMACVPVTEETPLVFGNSQRVLGGGSSCQKQVSHWQGLWDIGISLADIVGQSKQIFRFPADLYEFS